MQNLTPVIRERHIGRKWPRLKNFKFTSKMTTLPLTGMELLSASVALPLAFVEANGRYSLVGVLSLMPGRNMLVGPDGHWLGGHVPILLRAYPFRMLERVEVGKTVLCVDEEFGLLPEHVTVGEDFFDKDGNLSPALKAMGDFLTQVEGNLKATDQAVAALADAGLIMPWNITVKNELGFGEPFTGLHTINQIALNDVSDGAFLNLRKTSALPIAYAQMISMGAMKIFEHLAKVQAQFGHGQALSPDLQKLFDMSSSESVKFN